MNRILLLVTGGAAALAALWCAFSILFVAGFHGTPALWRIFGASAWIACCWAFAHYLRSPFRMLIPLVLSVAVAWGLFQVPPRGDRDWGPEQAKAPVIAFEGDQVTVSHFRSFRYLGEGDVKERWLTQTFDLNQLVGCDYIVVPFAVSKKLGHTMVSFRFRDGPNLALSVEARREVDEKYSIQLGLLHQFELIYLIGDEQDLLGRRLAQLKDTLYIYPVDVEPETCREFLQDLLHAAEIVADSPEWYNTLTSNCLTHLVDSLERTEGKRLPWDIRTVLTGESAELLYDLGLLDQEQPFEVLTERARKAPDGPARGLDEPFSSWVRNEP